MEGLPARVALLFFDPKNAMTQPTMIYVDADACPVKNKVYRVAERHGLKVMVGFSDSPIAVPRDLLVERVVVDGGMDAADNWIAERRLRATSSSPPTFRSLAAA